MSQRLPVRFVYHPDGMSLKRPTVIGSWDSEGRFHADWQDSGRPLELLADGSWQVTCELDCPDDQTFWWGVRDMGEWMLFGQSALSFVPSDPGQRTQSFFLGNRHRMGLNPLGDGFSVSVWAPHARTVELVIDPPANSYCLPLESSNGIWTASVDQGWKSIEGRPYGFRLTTSEGAHVLRCDPYARRRQGPQRGVSDLYLTQEGLATHRYAQDPHGEYLLRFEAVPDGGVRLEAPPRLRLFREGQPLSAQELKGLLMTSTPLPPIESWWAEQVSEDGSLALVRRQDTEAYALCLGRAEDLLGLHYEIVDAEGRTYHDPWSNLLDGYHNWPRFGIASRPVGGTRKRKRTAAPIGDLVIYELHIGSILGSGGNLRCSRFGEVAAKLKDIKDLGFTAVALMPTNPSEGFRDWGYLGTASMAHQEAYADPGESAEESLVKFIEAAHDLDLSVFTDVVYNHIGGDHNDLWNFDGFKNPWFEWDLDPVLGPTTGDHVERPIATANAIPQTETPTVRNTPWGPIPAFNKPPVFTFFVDHAMDQIQRLGFDGIRFDFTHLIHAKAPMGGSDQGWALLQEINRRLKYFFPEVLTFAEEFPQHSIITTPVSEGGAGFDAMWNTEHQHRLVYRHHQPSVTQAVADGAKHVPLAALLDHLLHPEGISRPSCSVTVLSNHDEVGNAIRIARLVAEHPRGTDLARLVCWFSLLCPGYPIIFQGTEDLAENHFSWGIPSSWDLGGHLNGAVSAPEKTRHLRSIRDVLHFRQDKRDLHSEIPIANSYLDCEARVLAFRRAGVWVVANFGEKTFTLPPDIRVTAPALLSSEDVAYGYLAQATQGLNVGGLALKVFASS